MSSYVVYVIDHGNPLPCLRGFGHNLQLFSDIYAICIKYVSVFCIIHGNIICNYIIRLGFPAFAGPIRNAVFYDLWFCRQKRGGSSSAGAFAPGSPVLPPGFSLRVFCAGFRVLLSAFPAFAAAGCGATAAGARLRLSVRRCSGRGVGLCFALLPAPPAGGASIRHGRPPSLPLSVLPVSLDLRPPSSATGGGGLRASARFRSCWRCRCPLLRLPVGTLPGSEGSELPSFRRTLPR